MKKTGGFNYLIMIAFRNIFRNLRRSVFCMIAVCIAVFFMVFMSGYMGGMIKSAKDVVENFNTGHLNIVTKEFDEDKDFYPNQYPLPADDQNLETFISGLKQDDRIADVFPRIMNYCTLTNNNVKHAILWGIDIEKEFKNRVFNLRANKFDSEAKKSGLLEGRYPLPTENGCAIGKRMAAAMDVKLGDKISLKTVSSQYSDKFWNLTITGIFDFGYKAVDKNFIIVPFERLQKIVTLKNKTQQLVLFLKDDEMTEQVKADLIKKLNNPEILVKSYQEDDFMANMDQFEGMTQVLYFVFIIVASFLIINTVLIVIHERTKEIGMMGALGMTRSQVVQVFLFEALFLSFIGSLIGALIGGIITFGVSYVPINFQGGSGSTEMPMGDTLFVLFSPSSIIGSFIYGLVLSSICTLFPSLKAAFIQPVEALRR